MEPWENEAERAEWRRVLVPLGATEDQADVAWLVAPGYRDVEIAAFTGMSVSTVKGHVRILFGILRVKERNRHVMGRVARQLVDAQRTVREPPPPEPAAPPPAPRPAARRRSASAGRGRARDEPERRA